MKVQILGFGLLAVAVVALAQVRVNINLGIGHPLVRTQTVVVHRAPLVVGRMVWAPPVVWAPVVIAAPPPARLVWEDKELLTREEDWVDTALPVHNDGVGMMVRVDGRIQMDFAEVHYGNGQAQVVDFKNTELRPGVYRLVDFAGHRRVENVRIIARARTPRATIGLLMHK